MLTFCVDPERITERIFGGPHFRAFVSEGDTLTCAKTGQKWSSQAIGVAWMEGRNLEPEAATAPPGG